VSNQREEGPLLGWLRDVRKFYEESLYNDRALAEWAENYGPLLFSRIEELEKQVEALEDDVEFLRAQTELER
jgi:hypothetical protein